MSMDKLHVLEKAKEMNVKFVRLQFTDIYGVLKNVAVTVEQLEKALDGELMFDGSSIEGFTRIEESDMYLKPDPNTFLVFPWRPQDGAVARLICDIYKPDGSPFEGDPRFVLKRTLQKAADMGYTMYVGPEAEFFLFQVDDQGRPTTITHDKAGYFDMSPIDLGENARRDMVLALEKLGFEIEASHHEVAAGQHEIDFKYSDALDVADKVMTFKFVVRTIAQRHGLHATFMPKPIFGINGSGMHLNQSLYKNGQNAFYDPAGPKQLSKDAYNYIAGLLKHAQAIAAVTNPTVNSYKRLVPGYEAPVYLAWSAANRSALVRIPAKRGPSTRVELRNPDPACNPYLAIAVALAAGLDGIKHKLQPPAETTANIYHMDAGQRAAAGIASLPASLKEAIDEAKNSDLVRETLGDHVFSKFVEGKLMEWDEYRTKVSKWEIEKYLTTF